MQSVSAGLLEFVISVAFELVPPSMDSSFSLQKLSTAMNFVVEWKAHSCFGNSSLVVASEELSVAENSTFVVQQRPFQSSLAATAIEVCWGHCCQPPALASRSSASSSAADVLLLVATIDAAHSHCSPSSPDSARQAVAGAFACSEEAGDCRGVDSLPLAELTLPSVESG